MVWDPAATKTLTARTQFFRGDFNIFEERTVRGMATHTLSQDKLVWSDGDLRAVPGAGRCIERPPFGPHFEAAARRTQGLAPTAVER